MTLEEFNAAADDAALRDAVGRCCRAQPWIERLVGARPYPDLAAVHAVSQAATATLDDEGLAQALAGHPRIGDRHGGPGVDAAWSRQEQAGAATADEEAKRELAAANAAYEQRFGHVYLVCATGRSAQEMVDFARARLDNDDATERTVVLAELAKINDLRLAKLLVGEGAS